MSRTCTYLLVISIAAMICLMTLAACVGAACVRADDGSMGIRQSTIGDRFGSICCECRHGSDTN